MKILKKYFELLPLFKNATASQFLFLLQHPVNILRDVDDSSCFCCSLLDLEQKHEEFVTKSPKFKFCDLQTIFEWFVANKVSGGAEESFCNSTLQIIADLAKTEEDKAQFLEWANKEILVY